MNGLNILSPAVPLRDDIVDPSALLKQIPLLLLLLLLLFVDDTVVVDRLLLLLPLLLVCTLLLDVAVVWLLLWPLGDTLAMKLISDPG